MGEMKVFVLESINPAADEKYGFSGYTHTYSMAVCAFSETDARLLAAGAVSAAHGNAVAPMWCDHKTSTCREIDLSQEVGFVFMSGEGTG